MLVASTPAVDCGDPGTPTNGRRTLFSTTYNSVVTYTCDVGYTLEGSNSITCQSNGQWSGSVPQCQGRLNRCSFKRYIPALSYGNIVNFLPQWSVPVLVKTEGLAQLLTLALVSLGGLECCVKTVGETLAH